MNCIFCGREVKNKGALSNHQMSCKNNPDRVVRTRSPNAGAKKGSVPWNAGKSDKNGIIARRKMIVETGKLSEYCEPVARRIAKNYLIETNGHECSICGISEWMGKNVPLVCDHISGDSTENAIENFRLVCCNCDAQLLTFKSKNRGKGRTYDREYRQRNSLTK
jgi:hypothetical protein